MAQPKREDAWSLSKYERPELQRKYTQGGAANGPVRNLVKAGNLQVSKERQFLHSKLLYTKSTLATRKFKKTKAFARFKSDVWLINLTYVDELAND